MLIKETAPGDRGIASIPIWEFTMMASRNRIILRISPESWIDYAVSKTGLRVFGLNGMIAVDSCIMPGDFHKDPADRIIVATARSLNATLVIMDQKTSRLSPC